MKDTAVTRREQALFNLEIKKKRRSSIDLNIHHSKVFSSGTILTKDEASKTTFTELFGVNSYNFGSLMLEIWFFPSHII